MSLRTRLLIAFFALAVLPMAALVLFSYLSSLEAFEQAVDAENRAEAEELQHRMDEVRTSLDQVLAQAGRERFASFIDDEGRLEADPHTLNELKRDLSGVAPLVESCEFVPLPPALEARPAPPEPPLVELPEPEPELEPEATDSMAWVLETEIGGTTESPAIAIKVRAPAEPVREVLSSLVIARAAVARELAELDAETKEQLAEIKGLELLTDFEKFEKELPFKIRLEEAQAEFEHQAHIEAEAIFGKPLTWNVHRGDEVVGHMHAQIRVQKLLEEVLRHARRSEGEIPFAVDREGKLFSTSAEDQEQLEGLPIFAANTVPQDPDTGWMVYQVEDDASGMSFGVARPVSQKLQEIRAAAARNLGLGLLAVSLAGVGFVPLSSRLTRHLRRLTHAADALAGGDLSVRVPVRSRDEIGQLAGAFNRMATDLDQNQTRLLEEERLRQEQQLACRLLEVDNERKGRELEEARHFQLSLLPATLPEHPELDIAVSMRTATEVGGDFYDFKARDDGSLLTTIGDATGHGAAAGTMVTVAKSLFSVKADDDPRQFLSTASAAIRGMGLGRMCMAMLLAHFRRDVMHISTAGMPPPLVHRPDGDRIEEVLLPGTPLGSFHPATYQEREVALAPGDTVLFMSDGFPELRDPGGEPLGYERATRHFAAAANGTPEEILGDLMRAADQWRGDRPQDDDITFVVVRVRAS